MEKYASEGHFNLTNFMFAYLYLKSSGDVKDLVFIWGYSKLSSVTSLFLFLAEGEESQFFNLWILKTSNIFSSELVSQRKQKWNPYQF